MIWVNASPKTTQLLSPVLPFFEGWDHFPGQIPQLDGSNHNPCRFWEAWPLYLNGCQCSHQEWITALLEILFLLVKAGRFWLLVLKEISHLHFGQSSGDALKMSTTQEVSKAGLTVSLGGYGEEKSNVFMTLGKVWWAWVYFWGLLVSFSSKFLKYFWSLVSLP